MLNLPAATAYGETAPVQVHPAPNADYWGEGLSNVHVLAVTTEPITWNANAAATLVLIDASEAVRCLVNGAAAVSAGGFPIRPEQQSSFGIPQGASITFQAVANDTTVTILEA